MDDQVRQRIENDLKNNKVMLYMKGTPEAPLCGFSAQTVAILKEYQVPFKSFNILDDESIRQGLKEYANWPTFPQLYVNSELVGGCDIIVELHQNGELKEILSK